VFRLSVKPSALLALLLVAVISSAVPTAAQAPSGQVAFKVFKVGFIVGAGGGSGTLIFQGKRYPLSVGGVSLGATIGVSSADLVGEVYNLNNPADIEGTYTAASASVAVAGGGMTASLKNSRGVELRVRGKQIGLEFSVDLSGLNIKLK
jgi:lipid-binding SYLF domain-containing protein